MSRPDKTPAPARRFVRPSSSATQPPTSARKSAPPFSQFRTPGSTASPHSRVPQFSTPAPTHKDEINSSLEDDETSPSLPLRNPLGHASNRDPIDDVDGVDLPWQSDHRDTPMPKRRKVSHPHRPGDEPIAISSSPSEGESRSPQMSDDELHEASPPANVTPHTTARFRTPAPFRTQEASRSSRTVFRATDSSSTAKSEIVNTLPDAFTPSRRKGKHAYVPGSLADTVRNWILEVSTEDGKKDANDEREVLIEDARLEASGRAITAIDQSGLHWLLTGPQRWSASSISLETVQRIKEKGKVIIRSTSKSWTVPLQHLDRGADIQVAGHWDLPP
ncbi:uncharacterized protein HMPREF1541_03301 [Cyphellophora europaea CBS 101466]|uniref:Uncharacterized protein n=1 Tax=Cyphellophora europaea (strain CBS 101466) TaxID=1220924 RepID=W2RY05_CYPE1|nr:uncharacterized protein HMPREF1541_03301 [Cyphellophora europaea CBS 101466]ETN41366.1 hypothetical protein HMPREF1541_03301 [Cyphellophora europaea CBS 101466]